MLITRIMRIRIRVHHELETRAPLAQASLKRPLERAHRGDKLSLFLSIEICKDRFQAKGMTPLLATVHLLVGWTPEGKQVLLSDTYFLDNLLSPPLSSIAVGALAKVDLGPDLFRASKTFYVGTP